jgi:ArsR family metal-binding transcriptional regulator
LGYGGCSINFKSVDEAIEKVSASLGGNHKNTAHHYEGKNTVQILKKYNSVIPTYTSKVIRIMKMINDEEEIV